MEWFAANWIWVVVGGVILLVIYKKNRARPPKLSDADRQKALALILAKFTGALEGVVDDTVGRHYTRQDRQKIAVGMLAIMAANRIPLGQMSSNPSLFANIMVESIAQLTAMGQISAR